MTKIIVPFHAVYTLFWLGFIIMWYVYVSRSSGVPQGKAAIVFILTLIGGTGFFIKETTKKTKLTTLPIFEAISPIIVTTELVSLVLMGIILGELNARGAQFTDVLYFGIMLKCLLGIFATICPQE